MLPPWLITYDIADPKRLARVGRLMRRHGLHLQHSAYLWQGTDEALQRLLDQVATLIEPAADDVRGYHLTENTTVWQFGRQGLPEGITLTSGHFLVDRITRHPLPTEQHLT